MGLRSRILFYLIGMLSLVAALTLVTLRWHGQQKAAQMEELEARGEIHRVMETLQVLTLGLDSVWKTWAYRQDLIAYFADPHPQTRPGGIGVDALQVANIDFLALLDPSGQLKGVIEVPDARGEKSLTKALNTPSHPYSAYIKASPDASGCGAIDVQTKVGLVCFGPTLGTDQGGAPRDHMVLGRWVTNQTLEEVSRATGVMFALVDEATPALTAKSQKLADKLFSKDRVQILPHEQDIELRATVSSIFGQDIAEVRIRWPRRIEQQQDDSYQTTQMVVLALIVSGGVFLMLLLDRVVVRRLNLLRGELSTIVDSRRWAGQVSVKGGDELAALARYTRELVDIVQQQVQELKSLSQTDALTGLPNRRAFDERLAFILAQHMRQQVPAALILMDVDHFKKYNDNYGHLAGDEALQRVAQCLRSALRRELDLPVRLGGEEFGVLLQGVNAEQAALAAEHIRAALQQMAITHSASRPLGVLTMSLGVAVVTDSDNATTLYHRADAALYKAKQQGRNRVHLA